MFAVNHDLWLQKNFFRPAIFIKEGKSAPFAAVDYWMGRSSRYQFALRRRSYSYYADSYPCVYFALPFAPLIPIFSSRYT